MTNQTINKESYIGKIDSFNDNWTQVEIFLKATGRLPNKKGDNITQEILDKFCERYEKGQIKTTTVDLANIYYAIKKGLIKPND